MINKKNVLGKTPDELGIKDAVHVAIVSVRAAQLIMRGSRCKLNEFNEAVQCNIKDSIGCADPFRKTNEGNIYRGEFFWLLLDQTEVPNVQHHWEHPSVEFLPPTRELALNSTIKDVAEKYGVTYNQVMEACEHVVDKDRSMPYPDNGTKKDDLDGINDEISDYRYDLWHEWACETGSYEFENQGSACCPEYDYPRTQLFT